MKKMKRGFSKALAALLSIVFVLGVWIMPGVHALEGFTELTGGLTVSSTQTVVGSEGRRSVIGHAYIESIFGTTGWASSGYTWNNVDYRAAFDSPVGDGQSGA